MAAVQGYGALSSIILGMFSRHADRQSNMCEMLPVKQQRKILWTKTCSLTFHQNIPNHTPAPHPSPSYLYVPCCFYSSRGGQ